MAPTLFFRRSALALSGRAVAKPYVARHFTTSIARRKGEAEKSSSEAEKKDDDGPDELPYESPFDPKLLTPLNKIRGPEDLLPPGAPPGTVPTDLNQSTGLERLEILGKMQGVDVFDMRPLDASRKGTLDNPIVVNSAGEEQFAGCTGYPVDSHVVAWLGLSRTRPIERCVECGSVYRMEYIGPPDPEHGHGDDHGAAHDHHGVQDAKTFADFVRPEYRGTPQPFYQEKARREGAGAGREYTELGSQSVH